MREALTQWSRDKMANTLAYDTLEYKFVKENVLILIKNSLKFVPKGPIDNIPAMVPIMVWCQPGTKTLSELMMV